MTTRTVTLEHLDHRALVGDLQDLADAVKEAQGELVAAGVEIGLEHDLREAFARVLERLVDAEIVGRWEAPR